MTTRPRHAIRLLAILALLGPCVGCEDDPPRKVKLRETVGKTTQDVRRLEAEVGAGGVATDGKIKAKDYITIQGDAYVTTVGNIAKMKVDMDMRQYEALNGEYPKNYDEFMEHIIKKGKPDGVMLPMLPFYQEYAYDEAKKQLVILEYPQRKKDFQDEQDRELGRK